MRTLVNGFKATLGNQDDLLVSRYLIMSVNVLFQIIVTFVGSRNLTWISFFIHTYNFIDEDADITVETHFSCWLRNGIVGQ